jgi:hypothetical protein
MNSRRFEIRTSFPPFSKGLRIPSMADDDWTEESRFESRSGDRRKGFDFESFMWIILRHRVQEGRGGYRVRHPSDRE